MAHLWPHDMHSLGSAERNFIVKNPFRQLAILVGRRRGCSPPFFVQNVLINSLKNQKIFC